MDELSFIIGLMRQGYNKEPASLRFIPDRTVETRYLANGQYAIQKDRRGRQLGYILHGKPAAGGILTIAQTIIDIDQRNKGFGETAFLEVLERAKQANCRQIKLRCAEDLEANGFWQAQGFELTKVEYPQNKRNRAINTYLIDLWPLLWGERHGL